MFLGIKEVLVVKNVDCADWPFPESAAAKLNKTQIWFRGLGIIMNASAKYRNVKYFKNDCMYIYLFFIHSFNNIHVFVYLSFSATRRFNCRLLEHSAKTGAETCLSQCSQRLLRKAGLQGTKGPRRRLHGCALAGVIKGIALVAEPKTVDLIAAEPGDWNH